MKSNRSNFMKLIWILLFFLKLVKAFGRYNGSDSRDLKNYVYADVIIPEGTSAFECLAMLDYFCGGETKDDCAQEGVLHWPKVPNPPDYVQDYFELLRSYIFVGNFLLPDEFCRYDAQEFYKIFEENNENFDHERQNRSNICKEKLKQFMDLVVTPQGVLNNVFEMEQQSRQNILIYMFYETKVADFIPHYIPDFNEDFILNEINDSLPSFYYAVSYINHMSLNIQVRPEMPPPKDYCLVKFPLAV